MPYIYYYVLARLSRGLGSYTVDEVSPMKLHRRHMPVLQPPKARLYILCLFLAAGILAGFLAGRTVASEDLLSLSRYVTGYARLNAEEPRSAGLWQVLWTYLRYPAAAFLLGCTAWGVMLIPLTCAAQGFFLSFAVQCFAAALGKQGVVLALAALGLRCLFTIPCLLTIAADSFACAWRRAERQKPEVRDRRSVIICVFVLLTGTVAECALVPRLFAWLMPGLT
ncbi:MAG: hypothetical protein EGQ29_04005 [Clostridiales bacterium]|nr:hypothetical protein [Clostridiales bacterium]